MFVFDFIEFYFLIQLKKVLLDMEFKMMANVFYVHILVIIIAMDLQIVKVCFLFLVFHCITKLNFNSM
jgi:hypothetical protein